MVGIKIAVVVSPQGHILHWSLDTANVHDKHFVRMLDELKFQVLSDFGFHAREGDPDNLTICKRGEQNQRMVVESVFSLCKRLLGLNNIVAGSLEGFELAVASLFALFNLLLEMNKRLGLFTLRPSIAHYFCL